MIEAAIYARLATLASGNVFWTVADQKTVPPYLVLTDIGGPRGMAFAGPTGERIYHLQVDSYAGSKLAAISLSDQAFDALTALGPDLSVGDANDLPSDYEADTQLHRASLEYTIQI